MSTVDTKTDEAAGADDDEHVIDKENDTDAVDTADAADAAAEDGDGDGEAEAVKEIEENKSDNSVDDLDDDLDDDVGDDDQDDDDVDEDGDGEDNGNDEDNDGDDNKTETEKENDENRKKNSPPPTAELLIERPTKRSRTAYFIFADHMRPAIRKEFPGEGVATQAKRIGHKWKEITTEEKEKFQLIASKEKEIYKVKLDAYKKQMGDDYIDISNNPSGSSSSSDGINSLIFPVARISKIAKLDPDVNAISKEAMQLIVKSAELFLSKAGKETVKIASMHNRRTLSSDDIKHVCQHRNEFIFLKDDIKDITKELLIQKENDKALKAAAASAAGNNEGSGEGAASENGGAVNTSSVNKKDALRVAAAVGSKPLTSYFTTTK